MSRNEPRRERGRRPERRYPNFQPYPYRQPYPYPYPYTQPYPYPYEQPAPYTPQPGACPQGAMPYTVQEGDTLENIADRLGVSSDIITEINPYVNFSVPLQSGQTICLPVG